MIFSHIDCLSIFLPKGTPVCNLPVEYKNFPVLIDYGTMRASTNLTNLKCREYHEDLKPGISIGDSGMYDTFTLPFSISLTFFNI